jgi:hypothetical protein
MIEVICAGSLFLSMNTCLDSKSINLASIDTTKSTQSTLVQANSLLDDIYLADNESEAKYSSELERLLDRLNIIRDPNSENSSDRDADERRRELETGDREPDSQDNQESDYRRQADEERNGSQITVPDSDSDNEDNSDRDADERRRELETGDQNHDFYQGDNSENDHQSDYRRQADEERNGSQITAPDSNSDSNPEDNSDRDADQRRRELE